MTLPLLLWFLARQAKANTLGNATWHYGLLLFGFFYVSRFLNENYLGFILALLAIGVLASQPAADTPDGESGARGECFTRDSEQIALTGKPVQHDNWPQVLLARSAPPAA